MSLNEKQQKAFDGILRGKNTFVSGPGGVGKSYLVRKIVDSFGDSTVVLAPTGIAALNIGGSTIHSVFKLPLTILTKYHHSRVNENVNTLFDKDGPVKRIIIDEVSMQRQDVFVCLDEHLKRARRSSKPFGGIQIIAVGDFFQLPPVVTRYEKDKFFKEYESQFAFGGESWARGDFEYTELDQMMRQSDEVFIGHLQKIRRKLDGYKDSIDFLNDVAGKNLESVLDQDPVFLCTTNATADMINEEHYNGLDGEEFISEASVSGQFKENPAPYILKLKYGAKVMMTVNDNANDEYRNGSVGYVTGFLGDKIEVTLEDNEKTIFVSKYTWDMMDYIVVNDKLKAISNGSYTQYPMRLSWACTVHKAQGLSLDNAVVDSGRGFFASGQLYVALSRLKTLEGLAFTKKIRYSDVIVDASIQDFYNRGCKGIGL